MNKMFKYAIGISLLASTASYAVDLDGKTVLLESIASGNCMQVEGTNGEEGTKLIQYPCEKSDIQKFTFSKVDDTYYNISLENGKKLSVAGQSKSNGVNIVQSSTGNEFKVIEKDSGFNLQSKHSNKFVSTTSYNSDIVQEGKAVESKQLWKVFSDSKIPKSCKELHDLDASIASGAQLIDPDGDGVSEPFLVYCEMSFDGGGWTGFFESDLVTVIATAKGVRPQDEYSNNYNYYDGYNNAYHINLFEGSNIENIKVLLKNSMTLKYRTWNHGSPVYILDENDNILFSATGNTQEMKAYDFAINQNNIPLKFRMEKYSYKRLFPAIDCENNNDGCPTPSGVTTYFGEILVR